MSKDEHRDEMSTEEIPIPMTQTSDGRRTSQITETFIVNEVLQLQSYLPHLQQYQNPLLTRSWPINTNFVGINETVTDTVFCNSLRAQSKGLVYSQWVRAGPRKQTYFTPSEVNAAIVSCGGLDPGINIVVREIVGSLDLAYNVRRAWGVRFGWRGFTDGAAKEWLELTQERVAHIHKEGGSILGYSADPCDVEETLNVLEERGINQLYVLGNVETCKSASDIQLGAIKRKMKLSVILIPKSIENNFPYIDKCIGFDTVVQGAVDAIHRVLLAASSVQGGIGIIKLGSGFMCLHAVMASGDADVCLLKAVPFDPKVVFEYVSKVIASKGYAIIVVEDGAAEELVKKWRAQLDVDTGDRTPVGGSMDECIGKLVPRTASGHSMKEECARGLAFETFDIGQYLKEYAIDFFSKRGLHVTVRLSTPEWYIRSMPALASDRIFCNIVGSSAVHAAFAGLMHLVVGRVSQRYVYIPMSIINEKNKPVVKETSRMYNRMIRATGQPSFQRQGHAKLITGRGDVRRAFTPDQALSDLAREEQKDSTFHV
ncbi:hypothetical protein GUITHDRAFT_100526 [Guillardia theta CCMP2712]|uniref:Phosphofructokinase domain-containing protein n=2 Tax=Guillardia theta TaxID=55529 RepID=L1JZA4_GUITC|nr:hypothetical protein GUITHDRAFT_100526 [Guillardia theta CCMP2712]EKX53540.1 hypothetical protein GUITHDRAFT_100526 [Guillardia theta CCMP2712]|eukprot:XP_005840520.1 hypothetical protein GUITHDRAFT_100526 [Guillardia theta CCMP2712]